MNTKKIPFSPPDVGAAEAQEVTQTLLSGWITTGPRTKEFEREIAAYCHTEKAVCLNSATACMEMILRVLGVGPGDEVITSAYTYTATASVTCHVGAKVVLVDTAPGSRFDSDHLCIPGRTADSGERPCDMARRDLTFHKEDDTKALPSFRIIAIERRPLYPG